MKLSQETLDTVIHARHGVTAQIRTVNGKPEDLENLTLRRALVESAMAIDPDEKNVTQATKLERYTFSNKIASANGIGDLVLTAKERVRLIDGVELAFPGHYVFGEVHAILEPVEESEDAPE